MGPFPEAPGRVKFLIVVVDYFTKLIEADPLACIAGRHIIKFLWKKHYNKVCNAQLLVNDNGL